MLIPGPDTRVVELRVHGILGTTPEDLVGAVAAVDVAGDGIGRIVRPADRLRRPAPGPVLKADGRPLPRTVEGYLWSGMTSGGLAKAVWALLFPFSLANVASWMLPPVRTGSGLSAGLVTCCRALLRLAALLLTMLLIAQVGVISLDLLAGQCLAPGAHCLATIAPDWFRELPSVRPVIGLLPILAVLFMVNRISTVNWTVDAGDVQPSAEPLHKLSDLPGANLVADPDAPELRVLHLTAALATIALLALGGPIHPPTGAGPLVCWSVALVLVVLCLVAVLVFDNPTGVREDRAGQRLRAVLRPVGRTLITLIALGTVVAAVVVRPFAAELPGADTTTTVLAVALALACIVLGVLLAPAALLARKTWAALPRELRPWAGGWMAAPFMTLAGLLGGGFGAGLALVVRQALGGGSLALPAGYGYLTLLWGVAGALGAVGVLLGVVVTVGHGLAAKLTGRGVPPEVKLLHAGRPEDARKAARAWRKAGWERRNAHRMLLGLTAVLSVGGAMSVAQRAGQGPPQSWTQPLTWVGIVVLGGLAGMLLRTVYLAAKRPATATSLGGFADLASFWPRESHPIVPPCYALKVVPELAVRASEHLAEPNTRVVLTGHSQGTLLASVAACRLLDSLPPEQRDRLGLVIAGAPLRWAYSRAFPAVIPHDGLIELFDDLDGRWRTLCRGTDPVGGGVTTWRRQVFDEKLIGIGMRTGEAPGALPPSVVGPTGALVLGGDHWLPDPERGPFPGRQWTPGLQRHHNYYADPEWDRAVACASGMESPTQTTELPALFRFPGRGSAVG